MKNRRVLVTGGAGVVGATLANALAPGNDVLALYDLPPGTPHHLADGVSTALATLERVVEAATVRSLELAASAPGKRIL